MEFFSARTYWYGASIQVLNFHKIFSKNFTTIKMVELEKITIS